MTKLFLGGNGKTANPFLQCIDKLAVVSCSLDMIWRNISRTTEAGANAALTPKLPSNQGEDGPSGGYDPTTFNPTVIYKIK